MFLMLRDQGHADGIRNTAVSEMMPSYWLGILVNFLNDALINSNENANQPDSKLHAFYKKHVHKKHDVKIRQKLSTI